MTRFHWFAALIAAWLTASPVAQATSFFERPFEDTVKDAPVIVRGTVGSSYVDWGSERDGGKRLFTYYDLQVAEVLKGPADDGSLRMREMGGEKDGVGMQVAGTATFSQGEDVIVMLGEKNGEGTYDVWGMTMGKYVQRTDPDGKVYLWGAGIASQPKGSGDLKKWNLDSLRSLIATQGGAAPAPSRKPPSSATGATQPSLHPLSPPSPAAAPQLQTQPPEAPSFPFAPLLAAVAVILAAIGLYLARKR